MSVQRMTSSSKSVHARTRATNCLALVQEKEKEIQIGKTVDSVERRWTPRIERTNSPIRRFMLKRMKQRAIRRALERANCI